MNTNKKHREMRLQGLWVLIAVAFAPFAAGCSGLVDSSPTKKAPEQDVRSYYIKVDHPRMQYQYALTSKNAYLPASDVLMMDMKGQDTALGSLPVYTCNWSYRTAGAGAPWYYGLNQSQAVALGVEVNHRYTDSWVELQSPLDSNSSWTFTSKNELITARVTRYGTPAAVGGIPFDDVIMVTYTGAAGTTGTTWFARGIGTIFTHIERPGGVLVDEQYQSMTQK